MTDFSLPIYHNADLAESRVPIGAVLTAGLKGDGGRGFRPGSTDRFWIGMPAGADANTARQTHPSFREFNHAKASGGPTAAAVMRGVLVHPNIRDAWRLDRGAYRGPKNDPRVKNPSTLGPWCTGDGHSATRWDGRSYQSIDCPNELCPYAQMKACKAKLVVLFYPRWEGTPWADSGMPQVLTRYATSGRRMRDSWKGLLEFAESTAAGFGVEIENWVGFPFSMTLTKRRTSKGKATDVAFSADGDLVAWILANQARSRELGGAPPVGLLAPAASTPELLAQDADNLGADAIVTVKPANVVQAVPPMPRKDSAAFAKALKIRRTLPLAVALYGEPDSWPESARASLVKLDNSHAINNLGENYGAPDTWAGQAEQIREELES